MPMAHGPVLWSSYDGRLVVLSVLIASIAAYVALSLGERVTQKRGGARALWLAGGATVMGGGIWSMHFTGMLAFHLPIPVWYDVPIVVLSLVAAIVASGIALVVVSQRTMGFAAWLVGGLLMGSAIVAMHYTGMAAMRVSAAMRWDLRIVALSYVIAVGVSLVALAIVFRLRGRPEARFEARRIAAAIVMGVAVAGMHYTGMAAATFMATAPHPPTGFVVSATTLGGGAIAFTTILVLGLTVAGSYVDRRLAAYSQAVVIVEASPNAMVMVDGGGSITLVNAQAEALFAYDRSELIGKPIELLVPERFRAGHVNFRRGFLAAPTPRPMGAGRDLVGRCKDGSEVPIEVAVNPITSPTGVSILASIIDITDRKRAEDHRRLIVEAAPNAMVMVDRRGSIALVNAQAEHLFGYDREELLGRSVEMLVPERFRGGHAALRAGFMAIPTTRPMGEGRDLFGLRKDGAEVPIEIGLNPITSPKGAFILASIIDITERKRAEELRMINAGMRQRTEQLEIINKELESFSYSVSHDLRAPVRAISGYARAIEEDYGEQLDAEAHRLLSVVQSEAARLGNLVEDLLEFSRVGRQAMDPILVDMTAMARSVADELERESCTKAGFEIADLPSVRGDAILLRQVWTNLLSNAIKYSAKRQTPRVRVEGALSDAEAVYSVEDNGVGFDMRYASKLFGVFQRLHHADEFPGTGIGLATVHRVVTRHGGRVWAHGRPGSGATFWFALPDASADAT